MSEKHPYDRIVAKTAEDHAAASVELQQLHESTDGKLEQFELEKTAEEIETIKIAQDVVDDIVRKYGGTPREVPLDRIHVLSEGAVERVTMSGQGVYRMLIDQIGVDRRDSKLIFASCLVHELLHMKSPKAVVLTEKKAAKIYRSGIAMVDRESEPGENEIAYFSELEEAIVAECSMRAIDTLRMKLVPETERAASEKLSGWAKGYLKRGRASETEINRVFAEIKDPNVTPADIKRIEELPGGEEEKEQYAYGFLISRLKSGIAEPVERYYERNKMQHFISDLTTLSKGEIPSTEAAFEIIARANFTGNYLPLARAIKTAFGKKGFRTIANAFKEIYSREDDEDSMNEGTII